MLHLSFATPPPQFQELLLPFSPVTFAPDICNTQGSMCMDLAGMVQNVPFVHLVL